MEVGANTAADVTIEVAETMAAESRWVLLEELSLEELSRNQIAVEMRNTTTQTRTSPGAPTVIVHTIHGPTPG